MTSRDTHSGNWPHSSFYLLALALLLVVLYSAIHISLGTTVLVKGRALTYKLSVSTSLPAGPPPIFKATQGDTVTLLIGSTRTGEVHLHGYEKVITLKPAHEVELTLVTQYAGLFPIHLHDPDGSMYPLAMLEVQPR